MKALSAEKAQLSTQSDVLRYNLQLVTDQLRGPAEWFQRGYDFSFLAVNFWNITAPWRRAKKGKKWRTIPRVLARFVRWRFSP